MGSLWCKETGEDGTLLRDFSQGLDHGYGCGITNDSSGRGVYRGQLEARRGDLFFGYVPIKDIADVLNNMVITNGVDK